MIRPLLPEELPLVVTLGEQFFAEANMPSRFVGDVFVASWTVLLETGSGTIVGLFNDTELVGVIGGLIFPDLYDGAPVAVETFWFVKKNNRGQGLRLLYVFEAWCRAMGAKRIIVSHQANLMPERLKDVYLREGYKPLETNFLKEVG